jgi:predicted amidohydrolase YtcJ
MILYNGRVSTMDERGTVGEAVAFRLGRVLAIGPLDEVWGYLGSDTVVIDLDGHTATPGLIDSDFATCEVGLDSLYVDLSGAGSIGDVKEAVREAAASTPRGQWVRGRGLDEGALKERKPPTRKELDQAAPQHPVVLESADCYIVTNTWALELAGAESSGDGVISRGGLSEKMKALYYTYTVEEYEHVLVKAQATLFGMGVTARDDLRAPEGMKRAAKVLRGKGELKLRSRSVALALGEEWGELLGSLMAGKYADLIVWGDEPPEGSRYVGEVRSPLMTLVGGEIVYQAPEEG